jgi:hypothetical protein
MVKFKEMTDEVKFSMVQDNINHFERFGPQFIKSQLGDQAAVEHQEIMRSGCNAIPDNKAYMEKYETAYANFIWMARNNFKFIREKMGKEGIEHFKRMQVKELKQKNAGVGLFFLNLIRAISPGTAFVMANKEFAYQLQWITPLTLPKCSKNKAVFDIARCKILDYKDTEDLCRIACQKIYPKWVAEQFKAKMVFKPNGNSCKCTVTPLK